MSYQSESTVFINELEGRKQSKKIVLSVLVGLITLMLITALVFTTIQFTDSKDQNGTIKQDSLQFAAQTQTNKSDQPADWIQIQNRKDGYFHQIKLQYSKPGDYYKKVNSTYIQNVNLEVTRDSPSEMTFRMIDTEKTLFNLPDQFPFAYTKDIYSEDIKQDDTYGYEMMENGVQLRVYKKDGDEVGIILQLFKKLDVFNTKDFKIIFSKLYTEIQTTVDTPYIYGLGDRRTYNFLLSSGNYSIWSKDQSHIETGAPNGQLYGAHPMWLQRDIKGNYHIIILHTSNGMQFEYKQQSHLNFKIVGGIVQLKFFFGGSDPREVIKKYHRYVNGWALHPFWSSGWHQSRWGYKSSSELSQIVSNYTKYQLPLDVMWSDLDYMKDRNDFTLDVANFVPEDLQKLTNTKNPEGVEWVPIIDPGIAVKSKCAQRGLNSDIYIKSTKYIDYLANGTNSLIGSVWPGNVFFPDFNHPNSTDVWHQCFLDFNSQYNLTPSGIWIDMNELANFVNGEVNPNQSANLVQQDDKLKQIPATSNFNSEIQFEDLPFNPQGDVSLEQNAVSISAIHYNQEDALYLRQKDGNLTELNFHSLNGFLEGIATKQSQIKIHDTNLTFILSRSTFPGSGRFVQHWLGDNAATWEWLSSSMSAIFNFNLYGTPLVGDDICGFNGDTNSQLCARWIQLGAFYPFARSHSSINDIPQEPWLFDSYVVEATRKSLNLRYSLLKFYYNEFVTKYDKTIGAGAGSIFNPLFYIYDDINAMKIDRQFAIGDSIIVVPVVQQQMDQTMQQTQQSFYIPNGAIWFEWFSGNITQGPQNATVTINFSDTSLVYINLGKIVPISDTTGVYRSRYLPQNIGLAIALQVEIEGSSYKYSAKGSYLSIISYEARNVEQRCWNQETTCHRQLTATGQSNNSNIRLTLTNIQGSHYDSSEEIIINSLVVYGIMKNGNNLGKIIIPVNFSSLQSIWKIEVNI